MALKKSRPASLILLSARNLTMHLHRRSSQPSQKKVGLGLLFVFAVLVSVAASPWQPARAVTSTTLNFQARLMTASGAIVPDGNYHIEFKLYNAASSSGSSQGSCTGDAACQWTETRTTGNLVQVKNGYLTVNLGSVTALPNIDYSQQLWLTLRVGGSGGSATWDPEMSPRLQLTAVPYAFKAGDSATLGGIASGGYIQNTTTPQPANIAITNAGANSATTLFIKQGASQTGNTLTIQDSSGSNTILNVDQYGHLYAGYAATFNANIGVGTASDTSDALKVQSANTGQVGIYVTAGNFGQTADVADFYGPGGRSLIYDAAGTLNIQGDTAQSTPSLQIKQGSSQSGDAIRIADSANATQFKIDRFGVLTQIGNAQFNSSVGIIAAVSGSTALNVQAASGSVSGVTILAGAASQTADLLAVQDNSLNTIAGITGTGGLYSGRSSSKVGSLRLFNDTNANTVTLQSGVSGSSYTLTLPTAAPGLSQCLQNDGTTIGQLTFGSCGSGSGVTTVGTISGTSIANGASIAGSTITLGTADASGPGLVTNGTQTIAGAKTLTGAITASSTYNTNTFTANALTFGDASNPATITSGAGQALNLTGNAASTISTTAGSLTLSAPATQSILIGATNSNTVTIGTTSATSTITVGRSTGTNTISIGSGNTSTTNTQTINVGAGTPTGTGNAQVTVGNTNGASAIIANAGTGNINLNTVNSGGGTIVKSVTSNSTTAFQVQNASGVKVLTVDTSGAQTIFGTASSLTGKLQLANASNGNLVTLQSGVSSASYSLTLPTAAPSLGQCLQNDGTTIGQLTFGACGTATSLQGAYTASTGGTTPEIKLDSTRGGIDIQDADSSIGANLFTIRGSNGSGLGTSLFSVDNSGATTVGLNVVGGLTTLDAYAYDLTIYGNTGADNILSAYAGSFTYGSYLKNGDFEDVTNWTAKGSASISQSSQAYSGIASDDITTTALANDGITQAISPTLPSGTPYTLTFYARLASGALTTLRAGYNSTTCALNSNTVLTTGWQRYTCTFTPGAGVTSIFIDQGASAVARDILIDGATLSDNSPGPLAIQSANGVIMLTGQLTNPALFQASSNSTTAFQIQNASGNSNLFIADTLNGRIGIGNALPAYTLDVTGDINSSTALRVGGTQVCTSAGCTSAGGLQQVPTSSAVNTVTPTAASVVGLTVNATSNATSAVGVIINQSKASDTLQINTTNTSGTQTNGVLFNRNGAGGTTTNGINITNTAGTLTSGLAFTGTIGTDISRSSGTLSLNGASGINLQSNGTTTASLSSTGAALFKNSSNSTSAFQIQNAATSVLIGVDTSNATGTTNLVSNPNLEINTTGWSGWGSGGSVTRQTTNIDYTYAAGQVTLASSANGGAKFTLGSLPNGTYSLAYLAKTSSSTVSAIMGYNGGGADTDHTCTATSNYLLYVSAFVRVYCTFTVATGGGASPYIFVGATGAAQTIYFDSVQLESGNGATPLQQATIALHGVINGPVAIRPTANSDQVFAVYNAAGQNLVQADTAGNLLNIGPGLIVNSNGNRDGNDCGTTFSCFGIKFGAVFSGEGIASNRNSAPVGGNLNGLDLYTNNTARLRISNGGNVVVGSLDPGSSSSTFNVQGNASISPTANGVVGLAVNATTGTPGTTATFTQSQGADGVQLSATGAGTQTNGLLVTRTGASGTTTNAINVFNNGGTVTSGLAFNGTIGTDITRSSGTLTIQGAGGVALTSSAGNIQIGSSTSDATATLLVLDGYNQASDPTGSDGAMYYNSSMKQFRCYTSGAWNECGGGLLYSSTSATADVASCSTACPSLGQSVAIPANYCQPGRVIHIFATGTFKNNSSSGSTMAFDLYYGTNSSTRTSDTLLTNLFDGPVAFSLVSGTSYYGWQMDAYVTCFSTTSMNTSAEIVAADNTSSSSVIMANPTTTTGLTTTSTKNIYIFPSFNASRSDNVANIQQLVVTGM